MDREKNYTAIEESRLTTLIAKYRTIIECKKTDSIAIR